MSTLQLTILCLAALAAIAILVGVRYRTRVDELDAENARDARAVAERADRRRLDDERDSAAAATRVPAGPGDGARIAVHVAGQVVQGTRTGAGQPGADGWIVVDDAAFVTGDRSQPLGGTQWFREGPGMWIQEL